MYRVKLSDKSSEDGIALIRYGITITHSWKLIPNKNKALEKLEKEGKIVIEEVKDNNFYPPELKEKMDKVSKKMKDAISPNQKEKFDKFYQDLKVAMGIMDSSIFEQVKSMMGLSVGEQIKSLIEPSLTLGEQVKSLMGPSLGEQSISMMSSSLGVLWSDLKSLSSIIDLETALGVSTKKFFEETMAASSFKYLESVVNSMSIRRDLEVGLMMSHNIMLKAVEALKPPIEEINLALKLTAQSESLKMAFENLRLTNEEIEQEIIKLPPPPEVEEHEVGKLPPDDKGAEPGEKGPEKGEQKNEKILPPRNIEEQSVVEIEKKEPEKTPPYFEAVEKEIYELLEPPDSLEIIHESIVNKKKLLEESYLNTIFDYQKKHDKLRKIVVFSFFQRGTLNIERSITINAKDKEHERIIERIRWNGSDTQLKSLFEYLKKKRLLRDDIKYFEFKVHFDIETPLQKTEINKIRWMKEQTLLFYLIHLLIKNRFLPKELAKREGYRWKMLEDHFEKKDGSPFDHKQCARAWHNMRTTNPYRKPRKAEIIEEIINEIKKIKK